jgi:hypothetical protein
MTKPAAFYIPVNFNSKQFPSSMRDYVHYFLNQIHWRTIQWKADSDGFVRLKHDYLCRFIPKHLIDNIREILLEQGVIEWHKHYLPDSHSYGFRLTPEYQTTQRVLCDNQRLNKKIARIHKVEICLPVHKWLKNKFERITFDLEMAKSLIPKLEQTPLSGQRSLPEHEYQQLLLVSAIRLANKDIWFKVDSYGRVHTPLTSLVTDLRQCCFVNGQPLVEMDLANSQPLIAAICGKRFFSSNKQKNHLINKQFKRKENPYCVQEIAGLRKKENQIQNTEEQQDVRITTSELPSGVEIIGISDALKVEQKVNNLPLDLLEYLSLCESGEFYESLNCKGMDRAKFKQQLYADVFFGRGYKPSGVRCEFERRYPSLAYMLQSLKTNSYRHSSHVLQNYEATIFIHGICGKIMKDKPEVPVFTIHDSLMTTMEYQDYVFDAMMSEFKQLGVHPMIREKIQQ